VNPRSPRDAGAVVLVVKLGVTWDAATLDKYLTNPRAMVPDATMIYAGLKNDAERADLIAYLETLH
jgi:cytochrome c